MEKENVVELIIFPKPESLELINNSPFCAKTEIFLRLAKIDYKTSNFLGNPGKFPKSKLPVLKHGNEKIEDSAFIQKHLEENFQIDLDAHLSEPEKAQGFAFSKMLEQYLYWSVLHERWFIDENWVKLRNGYFGTIPKLIRGIVTNMIRKKLKASAVGHGMSRHSDVEVMALGYECIKAISDFLGDKNFLLGDTVSSYDATLYAFVASILHSPLGPKLKQNALEYSNLVEYDKRMFALMKF